MLFDGKVAVEFRDNGGIGVGIGVGGSVADKNFVLMLGYSSSVGAGDAVREVGVSLFLVLGITGRFGAGGSVFAVGIVVLSETIRTFGILDLSE